METVKLLITSLSEPTSVPLWVWIAFAVVLLASAFGNYYGAFKIIRLKKHLSAADELHSVARQFRDLRINSLRADCEIAKIKEQEYKDNIADLKHQLETKEVSGKNFYEGQIKSLNVRITRATDDNRKTALLTAMRHCKVSGHDVTAEAAKYHRFLQGKV